MQATYTPATSDLSAYAGKTVQLRFRYATDGAAQGTDPDLGWSGIFLDDITLTSGGATVFTDGAETADPAWTAAGFTRVGASVTNSYANYYIASNRSYVSYDRWLKIGPVQLRVRQHQAGLRGALPVPAGPAGQLLGHLAVRQQHQRSTTVRA